MVHEPTPISPNNSKIANNRHISGTETEYCKSKLSENIQFEKDNKSVFLAISKNMKVKKLKVKKWKPKVRILEGLRSPFKEMDIEEAPNSRVTKSSFKIELRKLTSHFELLTRKFL